MIEQGRPFFLRVPPGYVEMSVAEQEATLLELWRGVMGQLGENPDELISEKAQNECPDHRG
ncbi:MAG: hypothetical protein ACLQRM_10795 [Acidimicrobiales bacterium]